MLETVAIGSRSWETALTQVLVDNVREVVLWGKNPKEMDDINLRRQSARFFPGVTLHKSLKATCDPNVVRDVNLLVLSVPTITMEGLYIKIETLVEKPIIVIDTPRGSHPQTDERMSDVTHRFMPKDKLESVVSLIGPSYAEGVVLRMLTTICAISLCEEGACSVQELLSNEYLRVYCGDDEVGSEIGAALKNTIAVASGVLSGVSHGDNTKAALITRGLVKMIRYGVTLGGRVETFTGLTDIDDLIVICTNVHSRNFQAGYEIRTYSSARYFWGNNTRTVEDAHTTKVVYEVTKQKRVSIPAVEEIYWVLYEDKKPQQSVRDLVLRDLRYEMK